MKIPQPVAGVSAGAVVRQECYIDGMYALDTEDILEAFQDEEDLCLPDLEEVPWEDLDYLGWVHPSGHLGYVVLQSPNDGEIKGIRLSRSQRPAGRPRLEMCSWCHHVHKAGGTAMFTVSVRGSEGRHTLGNKVCKDLDCSLRVRNLIEPGSFMRETLYEPAKIWRMQQTMHRWLGKANRI